MTESILDAVIAVLKAAPGMTPVKQYHKFEGFLPGERPTISISCPRVRYEEYENSQDKAILPLDILVYVKNMKPEAGETLIRAFAEDIRYSILGNCTLNGAVDSIDIREITYETNDVSQTVLLHYGLVECEVVYFAPRQRPDDAPTLEYLEMLLNTETIELQLEQEAT